MLTKLYLISALSLLVFLPVLLLSSFMPLHTNRFDAYEVFEGFSVSRQTALGEYKELIAHISLPFEQNLNTEFFSPEDVIHMQDVQNIMVVLYLSSLVSMVLILFVVFKKAINTTALERLTNLWGRVLTLIVFLGIIFFIFWEKAFTLFHRVLFPGNEYWMLDPRTSNLIKYFPDGIFQEFLALLLLLWLIEYVLLFSALRFKK